MAPQLTTHQQKELLAQLSGADQWVVLITWSHFTNTITLPAFVWCGLGWGL